MTLLYTVSKHEENNGATNKALITIYVHTLARQNMVLGISKDGGEMDP
jgi:hypothetical protein